MNDKEYTKHYFIEGERVCTKVGGGFRYAPTDPDGVQLQFMGTSTATSVSDDLWTMTIRGVDCSKNNSKIRICMQYLPFGELFINQQNSMYDTRYKFSAKELDNETGYNYFGQRYLDTELSVWLSVDPLSHRYPSTSPYMYVRGNPLRLIDQNGMNDSPIYSTEGKFLGTDDKGLQGQGIVMAEEDFTQGMSHDEAVSKNLGAKGFESKEAAQKAYNHYKSLPDRPDYDGYLTFPEATKWGNRSNGKPLFVDASKIKLSPITVEDVINANENNKGYINLVDYASNSDSKFVYGTLKFTLLDASTGEVRLGNDKGLLDIHDFANKKLQAIEEILYSGFRSDFNIYCAPCNNFVTPNTGTQARKR